MPRVEMEQGYEKGWAHRETELDRNDVRNLCRAVMGRAIYDLAGTMDYAVFKPTRVPGSESPITAMKIGEEVRAWIRSDEYSLFSFRFCADHAGLNHHDIRKRLEKYMTPQNEQLAKDLGLATKLIYNTIKRNPGIEHRMLMAECKLMFHPTHTRDTLKQLIETGKVYKRRVCGKKGKPKEQTLRWFPTSNPAPEGTPDE